MRWLDRCRVSTRYGLPGNSGRCAASHATTSATSSDVMGLAGQVAAPVRRAEIRPSGDDGRAQALIAHQGEIGTVDDGAGAARPGRRAVATGAPFANSTRAALRVARRGLGIRRHVESRRCAWFAHCARMPVTSTSICSSVSMPPARRAKAGIGVSGTPFGDGAADRTSSLAIARYIGFASARAAPPGPRCRGSRRSSSRRACSKSSDLRRARRGPRACARSGRAVAAPRAMARRSTSERESSRHDSLSLASRASVRRLEPGANGERQRLRRRHALLPSRRRRPRRARIRPGDSANQPSRCAHS